MQIKAGKCVVIALATLAAFPARAAEVPTASELLDKYAQALDSLRSRIVRAEITSEHEYGFAYNWHEPGFRGLRDKELQTDGIPHRWPAHAFAGVHVGPYQPHGPVCIRRPAVLLLSELR